MANTPFPTGARCLKTWTSLLLLGASLSWGAASSAVITLAIPIGARQMAMGESGTALAEDAFAVWWNPAGLAVGPVADEWTVSMPHPKDGQIRGLSSKEKRGFLGSAEVWAGADGGLWHFKDNTWRDWWSVSLEEGQTLRGALKRFVGGEEGIDTLLVQLRAFNGISSAAEEEELVDVRLPWRLVIRDSVTAVHYEAGSDRVWVGTNRGLWRFDGAGWKKYATELGDRRVNRILSVGATVWIATDDGLFRFRRSVMTRKGTVFGANQRFTALAWSESRRELWTAVEGAGVARLQPAPEEGGGKDKWALFGESDGLLSTRVKALVVDSRDHLWALHDEGLSRFTQLRWEQTRFERTVLNDVAVDSRGNLWIASNSGVWKYKAVYGDGTDKKSEKDNSGSAATGKWTHYHRGNGLASADVKAVEPRGDDVWLVTAAGVERFHQARNQVGIFYENLLPRFNIDDLYHLGAVGTFPLGDWGTIGGFVNFIYFGEATIESDNANLSQTFNSTELVVGLSYGTRLTRRQSLGVAFQFLYSDLTSGVAGQEDATTASYAVTVGWLMRDLFVPRLNVGVVLANMGPDVYYVDKSQSDPIPLTWRFGIAYTPLQLADHRISVTADYSRESIHIDGNEPDPFYVAMWKSWIDPETGSDVPDAFKEGQVGFGVEYVYSNTLALRLGYLHDYPFSDVSTGRRELDMGVGLMISDLWQLDVAMIKELNANDARDGQARISMIFKF